MLPVRVHYSFQAIRQYFSALIRQDLLPNIGFLQETRTMYTKKKFADKVSVSYVFLTRDTLKNYYARSRWVEIRLKMLIYHT